MNHENMKILSYEFLPDIIHWNIEPLENKFFVPEEEYLKEISAIIADVLQDLLPSNKITGRETSIFIISSREIRELKKKLFSLNMKTDVISIPIFSGKEEIPISGYYLLGEIYLSPEVIEENSREIGLDFLSEFFYIVIHGLLHLLGYGDEEETERREMFNLQEKLWRKYHFRIEKWLKS